MEEHRREARARPEVTRTLICAWPSLALQKQPPPSFFLAQAKGVRLAPRSQAPSHLQVTKQVHLGYRKPGQELATQPNTP